VKLNVVGGALVLRVLHRAGVTKFGVPMHELRGVGKNTQDHYTKQISYPMVGAQTANKRSRGLPLAGEVIGWLFAGKGMLTYSSSIVAASAKVWRRRRPLTCN
jgi:hypothetical protein